MTVLIHGHHLYYHFATFATLTVLPPVSTQVTYATNNRIAPAKTLAGYSLRFPFPIRELFPQRDFLKFPNRGAGDGVEEWLGKVVDREDLTRHGKWLCMMLPRLKLLREFLTDDGVIFVSIDDCEAHGLRYLMDEVFGETNFIATFVRKRRLSTGMRGQPVSPDHEYVVAYAHTLERVDLSGTKRRPEDYPFEDNKGRYRSTDLTVGMGKDLRPNQYYAITEPKTKKEYWPPETRVWRF